MFGSIKEIIPYIVLGGCIGMAIVGFKGNGGSSNKKSNSSDTPKK